MSALCMLSVMPTLRVTFTLQVVGFFPQHQTVQTDNDLQARGQRQLTLTSVKHNFTVFEHI
jgi:hypothetical protein